MFGVSEYKYLINLKTCIFFSLKVFYFSQSLKNSLIAPLCFFNIVFSYSLKLNDFNFVISSFIYLTQKKPKINREINIKE